MTKSERSQEELANGSLSKPLPKILFIRPEKIWQPAKARTRESYHSVVFRGENDDERNRIIFVRLISFSDEEAPRVQTDPFLDIYDNVPGQLAEKPFKGPKTVRTIIEATAYCFEDNIPNDGNKATVTFLPNVAKSSTPLGKAFVRSDSEIFQRIRTHLPPKFNGPVTLTLEWNFTEDPKQPFLEIALLNGLEWTL
ncbi:MAG: hypothetical protein ACSHYF_00370 [Verrucomicrobiaceae bacterium]